MEKRGFKILDLLIVIFLMLFFGLIIYGIYLNNKINIEKDAFSKEEIQKIQAVIEDYYVKNEQYPNNQTWKAEVEKTLKGIKLDNYSYNINGAGSGCYTISYTLLHPKSTGLNIKNGVYTLECKQ